MRLILNHYDQAKRFVATIGNYDGVHLGHQALLSRVRQIAQTLQLPSKVIVFEPQPEEFFTGNKTLCLTSLREKVSILADFAINCVEVLRFNHSLANTQPVDFINHILINQCKIRYLIIGDDFCFGHNRSGNAALLRQYCDRITMEQLPSLRQGGVRVSSSLIRAALAAGNFTRANSFLGRAYQVCGRVIHGNGIGLDLGFPTANINLGARCLPLNGVYLVKVHGITADGLLGVANLGHCPTFLSRQKKFEVHILDFKQQIYGKRLVIEFCQKIRDERKFASVAELKLQIAKDIVVARQLYQMESIGLGNDQGMLS